MTKQPVILIDQAAHDWAIEKLPGSHHWPLLGKVKTAGQSCGFRASSGGSLQWQLQATDSHLTVWVIAPLSIAHSPIFNNPASKPTAPKCFAPRHFNPLSYLTKVREYWLVVCMFFLPQGGGCRGYRLTAHHVKVKVSVVAEKGPTLAAGGSVYWCCPGLERWTASDGTQWYPVVDQTVLQEYS